jgi:hypothetical protein
MTITADLITGTFSAAGIVPDMAKFGGFLCCHVDLQRSVHMKNFQPEEKQIEAEDGDINTAPTPELTLKNSTWLSTPLRHSLHRVQVVKLEIIQKEKKPGVPHSHTPTTNDTIDKPSQLVHRQLKLEEMTTSKPIKPPHSKFIDI